MAVAPQSRIVRFVRNMAVAVAMLMPWQNLPLPVDGDFAGLLHHT
jgi:hypothetical protein